MIPYFLGLLFGTMFLFVPITKSFVKKVENMDLLFLVLCNSIFLVATTAFKFYFKENFLSACSSLFLMIYTLLLIHELKKEIGSTYFVIPYFLFSLSIFLTFTISFLF